MKIVYTCRECGYQNPKWMGRCPDCGSWGTLEEEAQRKEKKGHPSGIPPRSSKPLNFSELDETDFPRISTGMGELDRALGGGLVKGSLVLLGGEPGVGKSTLLLQAASNLAAKENKILYISGEESESQLKMRGNRLGLDPESLYVLGETDLDAIVEWTEKLKPACVIIDSIQTTFSAKLPSAPGSVTQVREGTTRFLFLSKRGNIPILLIGHVTKEGNIAGPKAMEHIVDAVLYFEGDVHHSYRIVRAVKNRFGPANELALFEMGEKGLSEVKNPSMLFLEQRPVDSAGSAVFSTMEGSRPLLVEIQALVSSTNYGTARRMTIGPDYNRVSLLLAVLEKQMGYDMVGYDIFVNAAGGLSIVEPAADLPVMSAISSSFNNKPIDSGTVIFGEVGLSGEVRGVSRAEARIKEALSMGFERCILPSANEISSLKGMELVPVRNVAEAIEAVS